MSIFERHFHAVVIGIIAVIAGCAGKPVATLTKTDGPTCPQWAQFPADHHTAADSPYLGCVTAANLRATLANPADLVRGRPLGPADGTRETLAVEAYQQGKVKAFQGTSASGGGGSAQSGGSTSGGGS